MSKKVVTVSMGENIYTMPTEVITQMIKIVQEEMAKKGVNMLIALKKKNMIEMRRDVYETKEELNKAIEMSKELGFKVYYAEVS